MTTVTVVPGMAIRRMRALVGAAGWRAEPASPRARSASHAVSLALGRPTLFVPSAARVPRLLRLIVALHGGSPAEAPAIELADAAAVATGARIAVLHVPSASPPRDPASLPLRLEDHADQEWEEWHREFVRRFCGCSPGVVVTLHVCPGPPELSVPAEARRVRADLIVAARVRGRGARTLAALADHAPCPVLMLAARPR
ncbi:MAG: universal stress protein [Candidatus Limnocylindria bacterium]